MARLGLPRGGFIDGVQAWTLSLAIEGDVLLESVAFEGTVAAPVGEGGLFDSGLQKIVMVDPELGGQGQGVSASTVLSLRSPVALLPDGTATILALGIRGEDVSR